jgi:uncharacterized membrane protein YbhN (UPF0104 family)
MVAIAALVLLLFVPLTSSVMWIMIATCIICTLLAAGMVALVRRGMLGSIVGVLRRVRVISQARFERWQAKLAPVDAKMQLVEGARKRDRVFGVTCNVVSRLTSMSLSYLVFYAVGGTITLAFVAATTVGGFVIYILSTLVPMGVGISEGGYWGMFRTIGENPARGVTMVIARRVTLVVYAAIGLVLMTASETVQRARDKAQQRAASSQPIPAAEPEPLASPPASAASRAASPSPQ